MATTNTPLPPRTQPKPVKKGKARRILKLLLFVLLIGLVAGGGYAGYLYYKFDRMLDKVTASEKPSKPHKDDEVVLPKSKPVTFLLLGVDSRKQTGSLNTDVIMVASFNPDRKSATIVSIPRDTLMQPTGYREHKANSFFAINYNDDKDTALSETKEVYGEYLNVPIDYAMSVNFKAFEQIVDELDGIEVDVDMDMRYVDPTDGTNINLTKGLQMLDGKKTLDFVRYRKSNRGTGASSDFERNKRQQQVLSEVVDKLKTFRGIMSIDDIFEAIGDNMKTDISKDELNSFIRTYKGIGNDKIEYIPLEGEWQSPYTYVNDESLENAKSKLAAQLK